MAPVPTHAEGPLNRFAAVLGKRLRRPVRIEWDTSPDGDPCAWLAVSEDNECRRVAALTIRQKGPTTTYCVMRPHDQGPVQKSAALATALRDLQATAVGALKGPVPDAPITPGVAPPPSAKPPTFTAAQAVEHPGIRAAILAGHQIEGMTGTRPATEDVMSIINAALPLVARISEVYKPQTGAQDPEGAGWSERVLVGLLVAAIVASAPAASAETRPSGESTLTADNDCSNKPTHSEASMFFDDR